MSHYFFDSSALVKRYVPEIGQAWVLSITLPATGNTIIVAQITRVEVASAVMRRSRDGTLTIRAAHAIRLLMGRHLSREYVIIGLTDHLIKRAEILLEFHPLRAYDSLQLASALEANDRLVTTGLAPLIFISSDTRLLSAARAEGLATDDPHSHP
jgi:uncharacterized protein